MQYYSQFGEEQVIESYFEKGYIGNCIDIGAYDGITSSNTKYFEDNGWYCLCVEPNPGKYNELKKIRSNAINYAISNVNDDLKFEIVDLGNHHEDAISSLKIDHRLVKQHREYGYNLSFRSIIVEAITLDKCLKDFYKKDSIDFISIDTEGTELDVLKGFSIENWNPKLLVIENNFNEPFIGNYLKQYDYSLQSRVGVNDFYVKGNNDYLRVITQVGVGDMLLCYGIIKEFSKRFKKVQYYVHEGNYDIAVRLFKNISNVEIVKAVIDNHRVIVDNYDNTFVLGLEYHDEELKHNPTIHPDRFFYEYTKIPIEKKWENFNFERNINEEKRVFYDILKLKDDEEYIFLQEIKERELEIDKKYITPGIKIINPEDYPNIMLFDFLYTIEKAKEVHVVNSCFRTLIDLMNIKHDKLFYHRNTIKFHPKQLEHTQPECRLNWKVI